ncbi:RDD family protein [Nocardiopsis sp. RSe5-2]|uniref:RDD family protein n=1 Tax=Nocardiopsis endophytica TaxID=3018445 RepID=A0ABT4UBL9_9ACTN|nr:RDD family protein [Nocardiopsis endophytica]MDA2813859.1 RDD family protein [Nocardiopsis endophytica]
MEDTEDTEKTGAPGEWALFGRRVVARVVDLVIATGIQLAVTAGLDLVLPGGADAADPTVVGAVALSVAAFAVYAGYEVVLTGVYGATPGKLMAKVRLDPVPPEPKAVLIRSAVLFGYLLVYYIPLLNLVALMASVYAVFSALIDRPGHRGMHDRLAGTSVVQRLGRVGP